MTGSVVDGEGVIQEAAVEGIEAFPQAGLFSNPPNPALDFPPPRPRQDALQSDEDPDMIVDPMTTTDNRQIAAASLRTFMRLPAAQRPRLILMDVLGHSL